jgi:hypothetical protein
MYQLLFHTTSTPDYYCGSRYPTIQVAVDGNSTYGSVKAYLLSSLHYMDSLATNTQMFDLIENDFDEAEYVKAVNEAFNDVKDLNKTWDNLLEVPKDDDDFDDNYQTVYSYFILEVTDNDDDIDQTWDNLLEITKDEHDDE